MVNNYFIIIILYVLLLLSYYLYKTYYIKKNINSYDIPIVIICWNNYYFVKNFINQLKKYKNPIILLDNKSTYQPLLDYYKEIKEELKDKIEIRLLDKNYGHTVYLQLKDNLPDIYMLSDSDLQLNKNMPDNFAEILLSISNKYKIYKVGFALDLSDAEKFVKCKNYTKNKSIYDWEIKFWKNKINNNDYELYKADIDTTFCLINNQYLTKNQYTGIRIAGNFTVKHLPWYKDYIKKNVSKNEINHWKKNNKSSSILFSCLKL